MFRFILRVIAFIAFVVAILHAVVDITRTLGAGTLLQTALSDSLERLAPGLAQTLADRAQALNVTLNDPVLQTVLAWPTWAVFAGLALALYIPGRKRSSRRFAAL